MNYHGHQCLLLRGPWRADEIINTDQLNKNVYPNPCRRFKKEDVGKYITQFFDSEKDSSRGLIRLTKNNRIISDYMAPYPIFCCMLCHMWNDESKRDVVKNSKTISHILKNMISCLEEHYVRKVMEEGNEQSFKDNLHLCKNSFQAIGEIAFEGLLKKEIVFDKEDFKECEAAMHTSCGIGILSVQKKVAPKIVRAKGRENYT